MRSRYLAGVLLVVVLAGCTGTQTKSTAEAMSVAADFEDGLGAWVTGSDVPDNPNTDGTVNWSIQPTTRNAYDGEQALLFLLDGSQDDGTIWAQRTIGLQPGTRYNVTVTARAWSQSESFNTLAHLVMYAGESAPRREGDFPEPGTVVRNGSFGGLRQPLDRAAGWERYQFSWITPPLDDGTVYVAVGISAVWETGLGYPIDGVRISATPLN